MQYNEEIIKKENKSLQKQYRELLDKLKDVKNFVSAEEVNKTINDINEKKKKIKQIMIIMVKTQIKIIGKLIMQKQKKIHKKIRTKVKKMEKLIRIKKKNQKKVNQIAQKLQKKRLGKAMKKPNVVHCKYIFI